MKNKYIFFVIMISALFLRVYGIDYGLPFSYHFDEKSYTGAALNLGKATIGPQINPTGLTNILFLQYGVFFVIGKGIGIFPTISSFEQQYRTDPSSFLLLARLTSAIFGTLNVFVIYILGRRLFNNRVGLIAALFLAVTFLHVRDSHYAVPDILATFLISLTVMLCVLSVQTRKQSYQFLAAGVAGYAIATKWNAILILIPIAITLYLNGEYLFNYPGKYGDKARKIALSIILPLLIAFSAGAFQIFWKPDLYLDYFLKEMGAGSQGGFYYWQVDTLPGWLFYIKTLADGVGVLVTGFSFIGFMYYFISAIKKRKIDLNVLLLSFPGMYFLIMGATYHYFARYLLPLIPFIMLFSAASIYQIGNWIERKYPKVGIIFSSLLILAIVIPSIRADMRFDLLLTKKDTRTTAKEWIEANIPEGAKIYTDWSGYVPYLSIKDKPVPASTRIYDVVSSIEGHGLSDHSLSWYEEEGYDYLIASSFMYEIPLVDKQKNAIRVKFYQELDNELELIQVFKPHDGNIEPTFIFDEIYGPFISIWQRDVPGPTIKVYKLDNGIK